MGTTESNTINAKPWLAPNAEAGSYALGMLGLEERKLLYHLTRNIYTGEGAVVELGAFCGASTCCLAAGLRDNPRAAGHRVDSRFTHHAFQIVHLKVNVNATLA